MSAQDRSGSPENATDSAQSETPARVDSDVSDAAPQRSIPRRRRGPKLLRAALAGGVVLVAVAGFFLWRYLGSYQSTDDAQVDAHLSPVSARVSGYVIKVNADDNEYVKAGTVVVEIDPKDYQLARDRARADLANAEATARSLNISVPIASVSTSCQL